MLQAVAPSSHSLRTRLLETETETETEMADLASTDDLSHGSDDEDGGKGGRSKSRRELPAGAVATLKAWLLSPEHFTHPYPTPQDQVMLMQKTGIDKKQLKNWFTNARRRIWKPMLKKQLEQGKLTATGAVPGVMPGLMVQQMPGQPPDNNSGMNVHYQQAVQHQQMGHQPQDQQQQQQQGQQQQLDAYGSQMYMHPGAPPPVASSQQQQYYEQPASSPGPMTLSGSIGSLAPMTHTASGQQLSKTDSHAVLMELFARDQDLVRQATESAGKKAAGGTSAKQPQQASSQHPMRIPSQGRLMSVPTLNSWPHFSSVSSLNNLGTMPGVKSITSLSGVDLASQGPVNRVGNLAQVKSVESMGKNDSYAFLEVFFGDRSSTNLSSGSNRGVKRERDEDHDVGLSLEDEGPSGMNMKHDTSGGSDSGGNSDLNPRFLSSGSREGSDSTGTLKRAYDDALAARGLISVSRSCEKLTDLALPAKMQRTLSQEYLRQQSSQQQFGQYQYSSGPSEQSSSNQQNQNTSQQYPGQHPGQQMQQQYQSSDQKGMGFRSDPSVTNASVEVPSATKCALCHQTNVDTQLRPCGHMFHERCLKPSLQAPMGPPRCPVDHIPMQSALLAVPTDEKTLSRPVVAPMQPQPPSWSASVGASASGLLHQA